jgi:hypothetical protein
MYGKDSSCCRYIEIKKHEQVDYAKHSAQPQLVQGSCLPGHVRVLTNKGLIKIKELVDVVSPIKVWTGMRWAGFKARYMGKQKLIRFSVEGRPDLLCSVSHQLRVHNGFSMSVHEEVLSLGKGCNIAYNNIMGVVFPEIFDSSWSFGGGTKEKPLYINFKLKYYVELFYWLGKYYADGGFYIKSLGFFSVFYMYFDIDDICLMDEFDDFWNRFMDKSFIKTSCVVNSAGDECIYKEIYNFSVYNFLVNFMCLNPESVDKTDSLPDLFFRMPLKYRKQFIKGFIESYSYNSGVNINMPGYLLLNDIRQICEISGVYCKLSDNYYDGVRSLRFEGDYNNIRSDGLDYDILDEKYSVRVFNSITDTDLTEDVFTLVVNDYYHQFVADGFIHSDV